MTTRQQLLRSGRLAALLLFAALGLGGCGLKGPLYLPDDATPEVDAEAEVPTEETIERRNEAQ